MHTHVFTPQIAPDENGNTISQCECGLIKQTIIEFIQNAIATDDENPDTASAALIEIYDSASMLSRKAIDRFCISLCGYSFDTIKTINK